MNLGGRLKKARLARKLNQEELVKMVPGSSQAMISALEVRDSETATLLFEFADALQVNPRWLLTGREPSGLDGPLLGDPSDPLLHQLIGLYSELSRDGRDKLLGNANRIFAEERPEKSAANPYGARPTHPQSTEYRVSEKPLSEPNT